VRLLLAQPQLLAAFGGRAGEGAELVAETTGSQSSSRLLSLAGAHALVRIAPVDGGVKAGTIVDAMILALP
jgi:molybdopterin biosynthesis enzyme